MLVIMVDDDPNGGLNIEYSATGERKKVAMGLASAVVGNLEFQKVFMEALLNVISNSKIELRNIERQTDD